VSVIGAQITQRMVIEALRGDPPEETGRWTPVLIAMRQGLTKGEVVAAIQSLRYAGKIEFKRLALTPSMMIDAGAGDSGSQANAGDETEGGCQSAEAPVEPVSRPAGGRTPAATSELMDATAGETAPVSKAAGRGRPPQREVGGDAGQATAHDIGGTVGGSVKPPVLHEPVALIQATAGGEAVAIPPAAASSPGSIRTDATHGHSLRPAQAAALLADIESYIARVDMPYNEFGNLALGFGGFVGLLRKRVSARSVMAERARAFMTAWPDGATREQVGVVPRRAPMPAPAPPARERSPLVVAVEAEASDAGARRQVARATGHSGTISATGFAVQAACLEESEDGFAFLRRKWPDLLGRVVVAAHDEGIGPGPMLVRIIEQGLLCVEDDAREAVA